MYLRNLTEISIVTPSWHDLSVTFVLNEGHIHLKISMEWPIGGVFEGAHMSQKGPHGRRC